MQTGYYQISSEDAERLPFHSKTALPERSELYSTTTSWQPGFVIFVFFPLVVVTFVMLMTAADAPAFYGWTVVVFLLAALIGFVLTSRPSEILVTKEKIIVRRLIGGCVICSMILN